MTAGARVGPLSLARRLVARAQVEHLTALVLPGLEIARAHGIDPASAQLRVVPTPRHATVLLLIGELPPALLQAACVAYAQMPRPRAIVSLGAGPIAPLPAPDALGNLDHAGLVAATTQVRRLFRTRAWSLETTSFQAAALEDATAQEDVDPHAGHHGMGGKAASDDVHGDGLTAEHSPMKMDETSGHEAMDGEIPAGEPPHGQHISAAHAASDHGAHARKQEHQHSHHMMNAPPSAMDDMPMPTVGGQTGDGDMPAMGTEGTGHGSMTHHSGESMQMDMSGGMDHSSHGGGFMSMVMMTQDQPRSPDGLPMEWLDVPFGPYFPGLPGGLGLTFTLDGDAVAKARTRPGLASRNLEATWPGPVADFSDRLARLDPLAPVSYRLLAQLTLEQAAERNPDETTMRHYVGALEWERAVSHLSWVASLAHLLGDRWLEDRAARLHHTLQNAGDIELIRDMKRELGSFIGRIHHTPLLQHRLSGIGSVSEADLGPLRGPVARGAGISADSRSNDPAYRMFNFAPCLATARDAYSRLEVRLDELRESLRLVSDCGSFQLPAAPPWQGVSGHGMATVETPRGAATLHLTVRRGNVEDVMLDTPSPGHLSLVPALTAGHEIGDALAAVVSLDLSPWEIDR